MKNSLSQPIPTGRMERPPTALGWGSMDGWTGGVHMENWDKEQLAQAIGHIRLINGEDASEFKEWFSHLLKTYKPQVYLVLNRVANLNLNGFLGAHENAPYDLAFDLFLNTFFATKLSTSNEYHSSQLRHDLRQSELNELIEKAESFKNCIKKISPMTLLLTFPPDTAKNPQQFLEESLSRLIYYSKSELEFKPKHKVEYFGLLYTNKGQHKHRPGIKTILIYRLEFIFRAFTANWSHGLAPEFPMPTGGKPCRKEIAMLVEMAFPNESEQITTEYIKQSIKQIVTNQNLDVRWGEWPTDQYNRRE